MAHRPTHAVDPREFLAKTGGGSTVLQARKRQVLFAQGDAADAIYYIQEGRVKLTAVSMQGREAIVGLVGPMEFFGEGCLAGQTVRKATARAMTASSIVRIDTATMTCALQAEPAFAQMFMTHLLAQHVRFEAELLAQLFNDSEKRLARVLLRLAHFGEDGPPQPAVGRISHEMLAGMVGTTRSRVTRFMIKFRRLGYIECDRGLHIHPSLMTVLLRDQVDP